MKQNLATIVTSLQSGFKPISVRILAGIAFSNNDILMPLFIVTVRASGTCFLSASSTSFDIVIIQS